MEINKDLIAASSTPIVLAILAEGDSYGYAILKRVQELSGGRMEWTDGMLYPVLHRLERLGFVEARWEIAETGRRRKYYRITDRGRAQLAEERKQWQAVDATLRGLWSVLRIAVPVHAAARVPPPALAAGIAVVAGLGTPGLPPQGVFLAANGFFVALFAGSGLLFRRAALSTGR